MIPILKLDIEGRLADILLRRRSERRMIPQGSK